MRNRLAKYLIIAGIVCALAGLSLFFYNKNVEYKAGVYARETVSELKSIIASRNSGDPLPSDNKKASDQESSDENADASDPIDTVKIGGRDYIGYISIPSLGLELPVMAEWSYEKLQESPCRYSGFPETDDLVIAAHNYSTHFGFISDLRLNDSVSYTDIQGKRTDYKVVLIDTLSPASVDNMTSGEYALTLFTCTYSRQARVTVRLNRM